MASPLVDISTGFTLSLPVSGFTAQIVNVTPPTTTCESINTSHQGTTTAHTYEPADINENDTLEFDIHFNPDTAVPVGTKETAAVLTHPGGATWTMAGHINSYAPNALALNEKMMGTVAFKVSGNITIVAG